MPPEISVQPTCLSKSSAMNWRNTLQRYGSLSIGLHWLVLILLVAVYALIELRVQFPKGSETREMMKTWHFMLGLSVFLLVWIRLVANVMGPKPRIQPEPPRWQVLLAKAMHLALYALMIGMPLVGWFLLSAKGASIPFFGLHLPAMIAANKPLAETVMEIHQTGGTIGYFLIGLHAASALFHHYVKRDNTLLRMLPWRVANR